MYLSYEDYRSYGGTLDETTFNDFSFEATALIDWYTFNRLQTMEYAKLDDKVKHCMYHLIKLLQSIKAFQPDGSSSGASNSNEYAQGIKSQENDGVAITYNTMDASDYVDLAKKDIQRLINIYLQGVTNELGRKVLYKGIYPNE